MPASSGECGIRFLLKNVSNLPALNVFPDFKILSASLGHPSLIIKKQREFCDEIRKREVGSTTPGIFLFPSQEPFPIAITVTMPYEEVARDLDTNASMNVKGKQLGIAPAISPVAVGCIYYRVAAPATDAHQTGFAYTIGGVTVGSAASVGGVPLLKEPIPAEKIGFHPFLFGESFFAD